MDLKKNPNVDIHKDRMVYRAIGFAFVLVFTFLMFSFTFFEKQKPKLKIMMASDDAEQVENTQHEVAPPPPPPPPTLEIVEDTEEETGDFQDNEFNEDEGNDPPPPPPPPGGMGGGEPEEEDIFVGNLDKPVEYKGGEEAFYQFLADNLHYPDDARSIGIEAVIQVTFVVDKDGKISQITTDGKNEKSLENEAKRVIALTNGKWIPGEFKKKPKKTYCKVPIEFSLEE